LAQPASPVSRAARDSDRRCLLVLVMIVSSGGAGDEGHRRKSVEFSRE
jgi:hypothetical protein